MSIRQKHIDWVYDQFGPLAAEIYKSKLGKTRAYNKALALTVKEIDMRDKKQINQEINQKNKVAKRIVKESDRKTKNG